MVEPIKSTILMPQMPVPENEPPQVPSAEQFTCILCEQNYSVLKSEHNCSMRSGVDHTILSRTKTV